MAHAVLLDHLTIRLGKVYNAVENVSFSLETGKITGFIGPSGAGKTTLIRAIVGRQKPTKGRIEVLGVPAGSASLRPKLRYMTQELSVYSDLTAFENVQYFAQMFGYHGHAARQQATKALAAVDLTNRANVLAANLSGGQKQRVSLAVALIGDPELLVLDEPTVGLDPVLREELWDLFYRLRDVGKTIIISSHVMDEAERCDSLVLLRDAKVVATGSPSELCKSTATKTVEQSFLKLVGDTR